MSDQQSNWPVIVPLEEADFSRPPPPIMPAGMPVFYMVNWPQQGPPQGAAMQFPWTFAQQGPSQGPIPLPALPPFPMVGAGPPFPHAAPMIGQPQPPPSNPSPNVTQAIEAAAEPQPAPALSSEDERDNFGRWLDGDLPDLSSSDLSSSDLSSDLSSDFQSRKKKKGKKGKATKVLSDSKEKPKKRRGTAKKPAGKRKRTFSSSSDSDDYSTKKPKKPKKPKKGSKKIKAKAAPRKYNKAARPTREAPAAHAADIEPPAQLPAADIEPPAQLPAADIEPPAQLPAARPTEEGPAALEAIEIQPPDFIVISDNDNPNLEEGQSGEENGDRDTFRNCNYYIPDDDLTEDFCCICYETYRDNSWVGVMHPCHCHKFCYLCAVKVYHGPVQFCPLCRSGLDRVTSQQFTIDLLNPGFTSFHEQ